MKLHLYRSVKKNNFEVTASLLVAVIFVTYGKDQLLSFDISHVIFLRRVCYCSLPSAK